MKWGAAMGGEHMRGNTRRHAAYRETGLQRVASTARGRLVAVSVEIR